MSLLNCAARLVATVAMVSWLPAHAADSLKMMIASESGKGCDGVARALGKAMTTTGAAKNVQYQNQPGAGGAIAVAQFANTSKGDPGALLVGGSAMMAAIIRNRSAADLTSVTPLARLAAPSKRDDANADLDAWCGVFAAPAIGSAQRAELVKAVETAAKSSEWQASLATNAWEGRWLAGDAYASFIDAERKRIFALVGK